MLSHTSENIRSATAGTFFIVTISLEIQTVHRKVCVFSRVTRILTMERERLSLLISLHFFEDITGLRGIMGTKNWEVKHYGILKI